MRYATKDDPNPRGPFTRWTNYGYDGWSWTDHDTLEEALTTETYSSDFVIMKPVSYQVAEVKP